MKEKPTEIEMLSCASCGTLFPDTFLLNAEFGAVVIGCNAYCSQSCVEGTSYYMNFDNYDFMRGDR